METVGAAVAAALLFVLVDLFARILFLNTSKPKLGVRVAVSLTLFVITTRAIASFGGDVFRKVVTSIDAIVPYFFAAVVVDPLYCSLKALWKQDDFVESYFGAECEASFFNLALLSIGPVFLLRFIYPNSFWSNAASYFLSLLIFLVVEFGVRTAVTFFKRQKA